MIGVVLLLASSASVAASVRKSVLQPTNMIGCLGQCSLTSLDHLEMAWSMLSGSATEKQIIMRSASAYDRGRTLSYLWDPVTKRENKT